MRNIININAGWKFIREDAGLPAAYPTDWADVNLPHTWNAVDGPMHYITDTESYNHYFGWYGGKMEDNGPWLDNFHAKHPTIPLGVSEYGCEGIITYHSPDPKCKDYSEDYQALYHEHMAKVLDEPMEFPVGKLNVKCTIGDIYRNEDAWAFFSELTGGKMGPDMPMWGMMQNFSIDMMMTMMGNAPESALKAMNKKLIAFDLIPE